MSGFQFKQFGIQQDRCAMKVGTDGVLLGAWATTGEKMLDIGTGTGLIALMMAQRNSSGTVDGIDIDPDAVEQARGNVAASRFAARVRVEECSIQSFRLSENGCYDVIVSNPPFFQNSLGSPDEQRHLARHADSLTYRELFDAVTRLLTEDGVFAAILPFDCRDAFVAEGVLHGLRVRRECAVRTTQRKAPRRYLLEFSRRAESGSLGEYEEVVLTDSNGGRSEWYRQLTEEFYLF